MHWIKVEPLYVEAQVPPLATGVSFARIDTGDWKLPQDNQRVSNSVFQKSPIDTSLLSLGCLNKYDTQRNWILHQIK